MDTIKNPVWIKFVGFFSMLVGLISLFGACYLAYTITRAEGDINAFFSFYPLEVWFTSLLAVSGLFKIVSILFVWRKKLVGLIMYFLGEIFMILSIFVEREVFEFQKFILILVGLIASALLFVIIYSVYVFKSVNSAQCAGNM